MSLKYAMSKKVKLIATAVVLMLIGVPSALLASFRILTDISSEKLPAFTCIGSSTYGRVGYSVPYRDVGSYSKHVIFRNASEDDLPKWNLLWPIQSLELAVFGFSVMELAGDGSRRQEDQQPALLLLADGRKYKIETISTLGIDILGSIDPNSFEARKFYLKFAEAVKHCPTDAEIAAENEKALENDKLSGLRLRELDVQGKTLSFKNLSHLRATALNASGATFLHVNASHAYFSGKLDNAKLTDTDLTETHIHADLAGSSFRSTNLNGTRFYSRDIGKLEFFGSSGDKTSFVGAFQGSTFSASSFTTPSFHSANLDGATFSGTTLVNAKFQRVTVKGADFSEASLLDAEWKDVEFDCETRFPTDFDPVSNGLSIKECCR